jgi:hypothetical protein
MTSLRIAVFGYIVRGPLGGLAWHHLQYLQGLSDLGHEVAFFEDSEDYASCYNPQTFSMTTDPTFGIAFLTDARERLELQSRWAYFDWHTNSWLGMTQDLALDFLDSADLLLNLSGINPLRPWSEAVPVRVLVDTDPVFTLIKHLQNAMALARAKQHNRFLTFGENLSADRGNAPMDEFSWRPARQPVYLPSWKHHAGPADQPYTTVMQWESYPPAEHNGQKFGMKSDSFATIEQAPRHVVPKLQIALGGQTAPRQRLRRHGWSVVDSLRKTATPGGFQHYLARSRAEFTIAKHGYAVSNCGWFSERSANYLASGRPVITQETGFSDHIPTGEGLFAFSTLDESVAAIEAVESSYERHSKAAREIAEEYFDSRKVLTKLLDEVMSS